jgi:hypothetical protein
MRRATMEVLDDQITRVNAIEDKMVEGFPRGVGKGVALPRNKEFRTTVADAEVEDGLRDPSRTAIMEKGTRRGIRPGAVVETQQGYVEDVVNPSCWGQGETIRDRTDALNNLERASIQRRKLGRRQVCERGAEVLR